VAKATTKKTTKAKKPGPAVKRGASRVKATAKRATPAKPSGNSARVVRPAGKAQPPARGNAVKPVAAVQPVAVVANPNKPIKNQAGLKAKDVAFFRDLLLAKRRELLGDVHSMEQEALQAGGNSNLSNLPIHMADMGTDNYEQEFTLGLVEKDRQLLREINTALQKLRDGSYGICEGTGKPISRARLEAQPWARYSIERARQMEKRGMPRRSFLPS
jgi:RNA polymerase-binding protein DksA